MDPIRLIGVAALAAIIAGAPACTIAADRPAARCTLPRDATTPLEAQIDVLVAAIDDCDAAGTLDDEAALKHKALLIKLRSDIAEVRRRHRGDLLDVDRARFGWRLDRIVESIR